MNRNPEHDTREHLLATGETLCLALGFTGMGLSELLRTAEVPKGSFYHYFRSKEAFGVAMLERYYQRYNQYFSEQLHAPQGQHAERLLGWYQNALSEFQSCGHLTHCLGLKLSAEVCDLSEDMRAALNCGAARVIAILTNSLEQARLENEINFEGETSVLAQILYVLWLGAGLQAKLSRDPAPLENALAHIKSILVVPVS
ncbi:TetR/AcrR family transcriptional regulator [Klebsiella sp. BIGb0407]|uniref:TetR/AcrR family transcriptional regulator n=1 Tax=Klebsiella sp. BIGb0407 TaxID=2940603 RepID=UPI0021684ECB|nr:TetR/AcrR family transcriptional regulator [Klebsiella sp. BIGb0407]MCS3429643.1 TetR/AcrR family transcriptional repressor of nem operon [Klebsiella sp. BIGb0407]